MAVEGGIAVDDLKCGAPPRRFARGNVEYTEICTRPAFTWAASKGGHTEQVVRCNEHAAQLRSRAYDVRIASAPAAPATAKKKWDLTSTNSLEAAAGYLRKNSGAVLVLVIRATDAVVAVDGGVEAEDVAGMIERCLPEALDRLEGKQQSNNATVEDQHAGS